MAGFRHLGRSVRICKRSSQLEIWKVFCEVFISAFCQSWTRLAKFPCSAALPWIFLQLISCQATCLKLRFQISSLVPCLAHIKLYNENYPSQKKCLIYILKLRFYCKIISRFRSCWYSNDYTTVIAHLISNISLLILMLIQLKQLFLFHFSPFLPHSSSLYNKQIWKKTLTEMKKPLKVMRWSMSLVKNFYWRAILPLPQTFWRSVRPLNTIASR